jgi:hypothetical protein
VRTGTPDGQAPHLLQGNCPPGRAQGRQIEVERQQQPGRKHAGARVQSMSPSILSRRRMMISASVSPGIRLAPIHTPFGPSKRVPAQAGRGGTAWDTPLYATSPLSRAVCSSALRLATW